MTHNDPRRTPRPAGLAGPRVLWIVGAMVIAAIAVHQFTDKPAAQAPPPRKPLAKLNAKDLQEQSAVGGVLAGAKAGKDEIAAIRKGLLPSHVAFTASGEPMAEPRVEKTDHGYRVVGAWSERPYVLPRDEAEAKADALAVARDRLAKELDGMAPAVEELAVRTEKPTPEMQKKWTDNKLEPNREWVVVDVQTSDEAVRAERGKQRFGKIGFWVGVAFLNLLAAYAFLRLDMWTRGYLTTALGVGMIALLVGGVLLVLFAGVRG